MADTNGNRQTQFSPEFTAFHELANNILSSRGEFFKRIFDPRRDIDDECGYPRTNSIIEAVYLKQLYLREPVANRAVRLMAEECFQATPWIFEDEDPAVITPFEKEWDELGNQLAVEKSYHSDEKGSIIWSILRQLDIVSGIGQYGILLIGINDGKPLDQPAEGVEIAGGNEAMYGRTQGTDAQYVNPSYDFNVVPGQAPGYDNATRQLSLPDKEISKSKGNRRLLFLRPLDESMCPVVQWDSDITSPRYNMPVLYRVTLTDPNVNQSGGIGVSTITQNVHWTRVIHVADNVDNHPSLGVPRLIPILNPILDVRKVRGGSGEMYWRGAFPGLSLETNPQLGSEVRIDQAATKRMMEDYMNGLQRYLALTGLQAKTLAPQVVDPSPQIAAQLEAICIQIKCPVRVFKGSERGELASSQDDSQWNDKVRERQNNHVTPHLIVPTVNRFISMGLLPIPDHKPKPKVTTLPFKVDDPAQPAQPPLEEGQETPTNPYGGLTGNVRIVRNADGTFDLANYAPPSGDEYTPATLDSTTPPILQEEDTDDGEKEEHKPGFHVEWPDLESLGELDMANIGNIKATAIGTYVSSGAEALMTPLDFFTKILGMEEEEAQAIVDAAAQAQEEEQTFTQGVGALPDPNKPEPPPFGGLDKDGNPLLPGEEPSSPGDDEEDIGAMLEGLPTSKSTT